VAAVSGIRVVQNGEKRYLHVPADEGIATRLFDLTPEDQTEILRGFGIAPPIAGVDVDGAAQKIGEFACTIVKPPQLMIVIVSDVNVAAYRSNILGGAARMPATLRELAMKLERIGKS
jgi:hypothetical protein